MSENLNRDFSKYEAMETEELEEILRLDAEAPEGAETDTELLLHILEVLASRRNAKNITGNTAQKAWKSFEQNYMPEKPQTTKKFTPWLRRITAAAAVLVLLIAIPFTSKALTLEEVLDILAHWAKETFSFVSSENREVDEPSPSDHDHYSSLQGLLQEYKRDSSMVPTWIPNGFTLDSTEKIITPVQEFYVARYVNGEQELFIRIQNYLEEDFQKVEIDAGYSDVYSVAGIDYYLFENVDQCSAFWIVGTYECIISGDLSIEEIKLMIDSIGKG